MVERADRKSKSLEENKGLPSSMTNPTTEFDQDECDDGNNFYKFIDMASSEAHNSMG